MPMMDHLLIHVYHLHIHAYDGPLVDMSTIYTYTPIMDHLLVHIYHLHITHMVGHCVINVYHLNMHTYECMMGHCVDETSQIE